MNCGIIILMGTLLFGRSSSFSQINAIEFSITDSGVSINSIKIDREIKLPTLIEKFGKPDRTKKEKEFITSIYDGLGISITSDKTEKVYAIRFSYSNILKQYPKNNFAGNIYVNGIFLNSIDMPDIIQNKLPGFTYENLLGLYSFDNGKTDFYITIIPGNDRWSSFNYNFFRRKSD